MNLSRHVNTFYKILTIPTHSMFILIVICCMILLNTNDVVSSHEKQKFIISNLQEYCDWFRQNLAQNIINPDQIIVKQFSTGENNHAEAPSPAFQSLDDGEKLYTAQHIEIIKPNQNVHKKSTIQNPKNRLLASFDAKSNCTQQNNKTNLFGIQDNNYISSQNSMDQLQQHNSAVQNNATQIRETNEQIFRIDNYTLKNSEAKTPVQRSSNATNCFAHCYKIDGNPNNGLSGKRIILTTTLLTISIFLTLDAIFHKGKFVWTKKWWQWCRTTTTKGLIELNNLYDKILNKHGGAAA